MESVMLLYGLILGLAFGATVMASVVWCIQVTASRGFRLGFTAAIAIALAQLPWALAAGLTLVGLRQVAVEYDTILRTLAFIIFVFMAVSVFGSGKLETLRHEGAPKRASALFFQTLSRAFAMPMRLPGYLALLFMAGIHLRPPEEGIAGLFLRVLPLTAGLLLGTFFWLLHFTVLAWLFVEKVPEPITLKSLNKLRIVALTVLLALGLIAITPLLPGFR